MDLIQREGGKQAETGVPTAASTGAPAGDAPRAFPLALAQRGERLRIAAFKTGKGLGRKLSNLGLPVGSEIEVLQRQSGGGVVVSRDSTRVALGAGTAQKIMVALATAAKSA